MRQRSLLEMLACVVVLLVMVTVIFYFLFLIKNNTHTFPDMPPPFLLVDWVRRSVAHPPFSDVKSSLLNDDSSIFPNSQTECLPKSFEDFFIQFFV